MPKQMNPRPHLSSLSLLSSLLFSLLLAGFSALQVLLVACASFLLALLWLQALRWTWRGGWRRRLWGLPALLLAGLLAITAAIYFLRPGLLPQRTAYDLIENRGVTERLVDPALLKLEEWEINGEAHQVLFTHPAPSGSTALVYPVRVEPRTALQAYLAVAPEAWTAEGDGVTFSVYVEDDAGIHLLYSRYVDPKHHQQDRGWLPLRLELSPYRGKVVRLILVTGPGPAGDSRYDWAGWGEPRLERPAWP